MEFALKPIFTVNDIDFAEMVAHREEMAKPFDDRVPLENSADLTVDELRSFYKLYREALSEIAHSSLKIGKQGLISLAYSTLEHGRLTCHDCADKYTCDYAWDAYNTNGDCLASK